MSVYSVPVTIGVDEDKIAKKIEEDVERKVVEAIIEKIEDIIYNKPYYGSKTKSDAPLRDMVKTLVEKTIMEKTDDIVRLAADILADKLSRSKVVKEKAAAVVEENL